MKTKLVPIGNSRGVRIPKPFLEQAGLTDEVELRIVEGGIMVAGIGGSRAGWAKAANEIRERGDDGLLDEGVGTDFDDAEWTW
jgi:antitoxin MazE